MRVMILAAGRGERLQPLTNKIPKPLVRVGTRPLIQHHLERLAAAGISEVVINLGWLGEQIRAWLGSGERFDLSIRYSEEPPGALETAGGIVQALPLLGDKPFAVISADVLTDYPFERLPDRLQALGHLILIDNPPHHPDGDFGLDGDHISPTAMPRLTFSGIAVFSPELFRSLSPGRRRLRPVLEAAIAKGQLTGEHYRGQWADVGTPERLAAANRNLNPACS